MTVKTDCLDIRSKEKTWFFGSLLCR